jgi:hypothetical protein
MTVALAESAARHIGWLDQHQARLGAPGAAILEHSYRLLLMGSFTLVVGTVHRRLRFSWDGRESFLTVSECQCENESSPQRWTPVSNARIAQPGQVEKIIERSCNKAFGA